jgi:alpha-galactosidase
MRISFVASIIALAFGSFTLAQTPATIRLDQFENLDRISQDYGSPQKNRSIGKYPLSIGGKKYEHGLGTHANSRIVIDFESGAGAFTSDVGIDDENKAGQGSVVFRVIADGKTLFDSGVMHGGDAAKSVNVQLTGARRVFLEVDDAGDGIDSDHADWADASFTYSGKAPAIHMPAVKQPYVLTPKAKPEPRINGAKVFGVRPDHLLLYTIAASGERPMKFSADHLPEGLSLDPQTGHITGRLSERGEHRVMLHAENTRGSAQRELRIIVGDRIALTPPMGWNSWNCWAEAVSDEKVRAAADAMVNSGLINHGWQYINIDDCWEIKPSTMDKDPVQAGPARDEDGMIRTNKKFPAMKSLTDYVHSKGLKIGLYSSPGPLTCGGYTASYQHEDDDARQYAKWGFDYLKYDWCSYGKIAPKDPKLPDLKKPYEVMRAALDKVDRDIVYSLCQYGMGNVCEWGESVGGNCWRTTGDINDSWRSMSGIGFSQNGHEKFAGPGHWNDPDMLVVGLVGWGPNLHPTKLTPDEQYTHISLWCLLSAPLLIGCDMSRMDEFTLSLLNNDEVLEVNQDPLGKQAARVAKDGNSEIWAKDMEDGSKAVGLFNRGDEDAKVSVKWDQLGIAGEPLVRDLWRQKDLGRFSDHFEATVPEHGVVLVRIK